MMISTKGRYALRVMLDLAEHQPDGYVPLAAIACRQKISEKYLESILSVLSKAGMLDALRGKGGGYRLAKAPEDYSVYEILCLTEETLAPVTCLEDGRVCENAASCRTYPLWQGLDETVRNYLSGFTLVDVLHMKKYQTLPCAFPIGEGAFLRKKPPHPSRRCSNSCGRKHH